MNVSNWKPSQALSYDQVLKSKKDIYTSHGLVSCQVALLHSLLVVYEKNQALKMTLQSETSVRGLHLSRLHKNISSFTKQTHVMHPLQSYLIVGEGLGRLPITNIHLKTIEFYQVSFEDANETSPIQLFPLEEESSDLFRKRLFQLQTRLEIVRMKDVSGIRIKLKAKECERHTSHALCLSLSFPDAKLKRLVLLVLFCRYSPETVVALVSSF
ncbi:hypothetical protein YC2023_061180 [Brassica napus]